MSFIAPNPIVGHCCALVTPSNTGLRFPTPRQCSRKIAVTRTVKDKGELGFCKHHDPVNEEARDAAQQAKWKAESDAKQAAWRRRSDESRACEGMKDPVAAVKAAKDALGQATGGSSAVGKEHHDATCGCDFCKCRRALRMLKGEL